MPTSTTRTTAGATPKTIRQAFDAYLKAQTVQARAHPLAALAQKLATQLDAKPTALMAKEFRDTVDRLRELFPPKEKNDRFDELQARRNRRQSRSRTA